jgi:hypothetical protein
VAEEVKPEQEEPSAAPAATLDALAESVNGYPPNAFTFLPALVRPQSRGYLRPHHHDRGVCVTAAGGRLSGSRNGTTFGWKEALVTFKANPSGAQIAQAVGPLRRALAGRKGVKDMKRSVRSVRHSSSSNDCRSNGYRRRYVGRAEPQHSPERWVDLASPGIARDLNHHAANGLGMGV